MKSLVITFIADDKPGLVNLLSKTLTDYQGNWLESSLSHLGGKFTGILLVQVPDEQITALKQALSDLSAEGMQVSVELSRNDSDQQTQRVMLELIGQDKPGIVREISAVLANHQVNVIKLNTELKSGSMSGELLFIAEGELEVPESVELDQIQEALESIANDLMVDINLS